MRESGPVFLVENMSCEVQGLELGLALESIKKKLCLFCNSMRIVKFHCLLRSRKMHLPIHYS